jgi:hypothetical protein
MDAGSVIIVLFLVFAVPLGLAWAQSTWEIRSDRLREERLAVRAAESAPVVDDTNGDAEGVLPAATSTRKAK